MDYEFSILAAKFSLKCGPVESGAGKEFERERESAIMSRRDGFLRECAIKQRKNRRFNCDLLGEN